MKKWLVVMLSFILGIWVWQAGRSLLQIRVSPPEVKSLGGGGGCQYFVFSAEGARIEYLYGMLAEDPVHDLFWIEPQKLADDGLAEAIADTPCVEYPRVLSADYVEELYVSSCVQDLTETELAGVTDKAHLHLLAHHLLGVAEQGRGQAHLGISSIGQYLLDDHRVVHVG